MESMVPVCDKRYHIYNRFRHFWAEIKKLWNYPLSTVVDNLEGKTYACTFINTVCKMKHQYFKTKGLYFYNNNNHISIK